MHKYDITEQEYKEVKQLAKYNKLKRVDKRLQVIILRYEGKNFDEIAKKLNYNPKWVAQLCVDFKKQGIEEYSRHKFGGNNQVLSWDEETEILNTFKDKAIAGEMVTALDIKKAFDEKRGKDTGRGYIYMLLSRHNWRTVMPRSKHPNKASDEDIESSKKLTIHTKS